MAAIDFEGTLCEKCMFQDGFSVNGPACRKGLRARDAWNVCSGYKHRFTCTDELSDAEYELMDL